MNREKEIIKIKEILNQIKNITLYESIINKCNSIIEILNKMQTARLDSKALLEANHKLSDEKRFVISDIKILINYFKGDSKLKYQAENIMKNYKKEKEDDDRDK